MTLFHELILDSFNTGLQAVIEYELSEFDETALWDARRLGGGIPEGVRLHVNTGRVSDYLGNPLSWPICSARLRSLLEKRAKSDFEAFPAPIFDQFGRPLSSYSLINILTRLDCLNWDKSNITYMTIEGKRIPCVNEFVFDEKQVPTAVHIFRVPETPSSVFISDALAQDMVGKGFTGLALVRIRSSR
jgi:hypothetical protein